MPIKSIYSGYGGYAAGITAMKGCAPMGAPYTPSFRMKVSRWGMDSQAVADFRAAVDAWDGESPVYEYVEEAMGLVNSCTPAGDGFPINFENAPAALSDPDWTHEAEIPLASQSDWPPSEDSVIDLLSTSYGLVYGFVFHIPASVTGGNIATVVSLPQDDWWHGKNEWWGQNSGNPVVLDGDYSFDDAFNGTATLPGLGGLYLVEFSVVSGESESPVRKLLFFQSNALMDIFSVIGTDTTTGVVYALTGSATPHIAHVNGPGINTGALDPDATPPVFPLANLEVEFAIKYELFVSGGSGATEQYKFGRTYAQRYAGTPDEVIEFKIKSKYGNTTWTDERTGQSYAFSFLVQSSAMALGFQATHPDDLANWIAANPGCLANIYVDYSDDFKAAHPDLVADYLPALSTYGSPSQN